MPSKTVPSAVEGKWPPMHDAIWRGIWSDDLSQLEAMLKDGADISQIADSHASTNTTVLHSAADGTVELLDLLLDNGAKELLEVKCGPGEEGRWSGHTTLQMAAKQGRRDIARRLIAVGAEYDIFSAVALGDMDRVSQLVGRDETVCHGTTPLHWAARNAHVDSAQLLLDHGADIDVMDNIECPPLWYAAYWGNNAAMTHFLCEKGADASFRNIWGKDISAYDCGYGCYSIISGYRK